MTAAEQRESISDLLDRAEANIDVVKRRLSMLQSFVSELDEVTRGKEFRVWNEGVWVMLLDSRDLLVISLTSWCKAQWSPGGLFGQLGAHHLKGLKQGLPKAAQPAPGEANAREGAYRRLFPEASGANRTTPKPDDVEWLKLEFKRRIEASGLVADRDDNRAHPFERGKGSASVGMLELDDIETVLTGVEELLNDLSLIARRSNRSTGRVPGFTHAACDLVDLVLGGSVGRMWEVWGVSEARGDDAKDDQWWWQYRATYYQRIHDAHDARAENAGSPLFNDLPREASLP